jgi:predicted alpha/beta-hydrolase family hydrolase
VTAPRPAAAPTRVVDVETPTGPARAHVFAPPRAAPAGRPGLVLGHGAGGGIGAADLQAVASALPATGVPVVLVEQPWRVAGRRVAAPPARLDEAWLAVLPALVSGRAAPLRGRRVVAGGRSAGARVACRTAQAVGAAGVVCLAFPLHPPGRPDRSRAGELLAAGVATLVVQGGRDAFGGPGELPAGPEVVPVPYADHSLAVPAAAPLTRAEALELVVAAVRGFVDRF